MTSKHNDFSLILPCYNEVSVFEESVHTIISILKRSGFSFEIIFVDDQSTDGTIELIKKTTKSYSFCHSVFHIKNQGRGKTVVDGIEISSGDVVGYIDIDCEVSPVYIPECVDVIMQKKADVVVGKRIYRTTFASIFREIFSLGYKYLADTLVGTKHIDTESGYKFFNRKKILPILPLCTHPHWFWDTEIIVWSVKKGLNVKEIPVLFLRRFDKTSSVSIVKDIWDYCVSLWRFKKRMIEDRR
jgi:glycosyltransferase involved in cell wall biosynthesis